MGYHTDFDGQFKLSRDLSIKEFNALNKLTKNMGDKSKGQPYSWCMWVPTEDGDAIEWDGGEKFHDYIEWLQYVVDKYLKPWGITLSGKVEYDGEERGDYGYLEVIDGKVTDFPKQDV
jgi:hypothetical protein